MKKIIYTLAALIVVLLAIGVGLTLQNKNISQPTQLTPSPTSPQTVSPTTPSAPQSDANITISSPTRNQTITLPFQITGTARVFENVIAYRITDSQGKILAEGTGYANASDVGLYGPFSIPVNSLASTTATNGTVSVFSHSPKDGSEINSISVPIIFSKQQNSKTIQLYFGRTGTNPAECEQVVAVNRVVTNTASIPRTAVEELLKGPTSTEKAQGYITSINSGVSIQKLTIVNGVARIDFNERIEEQVGGSCRVAAIRAQITRTLSQFSSVNSVVISINGRTEDILQP